MLKGACKEDVTLDVDQNKVGQAMLRNARLYDNSMSFVDYISDYINQKFTIKNDSV